MIRATLELPPATDAELEMLDILTKAGGGCHVDSDRNASVALSLARTLECLSISVIFVLIIGRACNVMPTMPWLINDEIGRSRFAPLQLSRAPSLSDSSLLSMWLVNQHAYVIRQQMGLCLWKR